MNKRPYRLMVLMLLLPLSALYGVAPLFLPNPIHNQAPFAQFSAGRAIQHAAIIGSQIHPVGSPEMQAVVSYLETTLRAAGLEPVVQQATGTYGGTSRALSNVLARIPGREPGGAVLFLAHPDSTPYGAGAGDNATGAAVLLELGRALRSGPQLKNDIILLFDDGEEYGYLGGYAFVDEHPWMAEVRLAIGLDTAAWGPVVLLQTGPDNGELVRSYAQSVSSPLAFGFLEAANTISGDTSEILPFIERGIPGLELEDITAFAGKHALEDTIERVLPGSVQQAGDQLIELARYLGEADLSQMSASDRSFFTMWKAGVVHYPARANLWLAIAAVLAYAGIWLLGVRRGLFVARRLAVACLYSLGTVALVGLLGLAAAKLFELWFPKPHPYIGNYLLPASLPFLLVCLALMISGYLVLRRWIANKVGVDNLAFGVLTTWLLLSLATSVMMPVGSYAFVLPVISGLGSWGWTLARTRPGSRLPGGAALLVPAVAATVLLAPNLVLSYTGTGVAILPMIVPLLVAILDLWLPFAEMNHLEGSRPVTEKNN